FGVQRVHGPENALVPTYEPLSLIWEGVQVARAATALYKALSLSEGQKRQKILEKIIQTNQKTYVNDEFETSVFNILIGLHKQPHNLIEWTTLALEGLADITDNCLAGEFSLLWAEAGGMRRSLTQEWKVRSHLGALFLKMAHQLTKRRY